MYKALWSAAIAAGLTLAGSGRASEMVIGGSFAKLCHDAAEQAADHGTRNPEAQTVCNIAIAGENLSVHDLAASFANRGILLLADNAYAAATKDFDKAIELEPKMGGAYTDRGAALIAQGQFAEGVAEIDRGLALNSSEPEKAYFNRALGRERLGDAKGAYQDFMMAAKLKPNWEPPRAQLTRFTVRPVLQ